MKSLIVACMDRDAVLVLLVADDFLVERDLSCWDLRQQEVVEVGAMED